MKWFLRILAFLTALSVANAAEIEDLNTTDASNTGRFPENMAPSAVNDGARALEGLLARWHEDANCRKATTGSSNAYVFAAAQTLSAYYDGLTICFDANFANTASATLNVDSVSADTIVTPNGQALVGGEIISGQKVLVRHDGTNWVLMSVTTTSAVVWYSSDAGATAGPTLTCDRDSASPAADDIMCELDFVGEDSGGNDHTYAELRAVIVSPTDGSETGRLEVDASNGLNFSGGSAGPTITASGGGNPQVVIPRGHIDGFVMSNAADANHDIALTAGQAADSGNAEFMTRGANLIKQIDVNWTAGTNSGGFPSGLTLSADTWYHFFVIRDSDSGTVDGGYDTSLTATNLLADATAYETYRRVGSVLTDSSSNILDFSQLRDQFCWDDPPLDVDVTNQGTSAVSRVLSVPTGVQVWAEINAHVDGASNHRVYISTLDANDEAPSQSAAPLSSLLASSANESSSFMSVRTDTSAQVRTRSDIASTTLRITTLCWVDPRGKN